MNERNIGPISVINPISPAVNRVREILFSPFNLGKWFIIGFCAWLAYLGEGGGGNFNFNFGDGSHRGGPGPEIAHIKQTVMSNLPIVVGIACGVFILIIAITLLVMWLKSRGQFMFLHCVAVNKGEVAVPWKKYARQANSLFVFYLVLALLGFVIFIPPIVGIIIMVIPMIQREAFLAGPFIIILALVLVMVILGIAFAIIKKFTLDFVVPIMYLRGCGVKQGWSEFNSILKANTGRFILYILFNIVICFAIGAIVFMVCIAGCLCCCLWCIMALPYIGTVLLLPIFAFKRAYPLYYIAQYGDAYNVFEPAPVQAEIIQ